MVGMTQMVYIPLARSIYLHKNVLCNDTCSVGRVCVCVCVWGGGGGGGVGGGGAG